jgi:hypothetical protein
MTFLWSFNKHWDMWIAILKDIKVDPYLTPHIRVHSRQIRECGDSRLRRKHRSVPAGKPLRPQNSGA